MLSPSMRNFKPPVPWLTVFTRRMNPYFCSSSWAAARPPPTASASARARLKIVLIDDFGLHFIRVEGAVAPPFAGVHENGEGLADFGDHFRIPVVLVRWRKG